MATIYEIVGKLTADASGLQKGLKSAVQSMMKFSGSVKKYLVAPIISAVAKWQEQIGKNEMLLAGLVDDVGNVKTAVREMAKDGVFGIGALTEAGLAFARAGKTDATVMGEWIDVAADLALVTGQDLNDAVDSLIKTTNSFAFTSAEAAKTAMGQMSMAANNSAQTMGDLDGALTYSMATASGAGVKFSELNAALMVMADQGMKGTKAGTRLKNAITEIQKSGDLGGLASFTEGNLDLFKTMENINGELGQFQTLQERNMWINENFNTRAADAIRMLTGDIKNMSDAMEKVSADTVNAELDRIKNKMEQELGYRLTVLQKQWNDMSNELVESFVPALEMLIPKITELMDWISGLDDSTKQWAISIVGILVLLALLSTIILPIINLLKLLKVQIVAVYLAKKIWIVITTLATAVQSVYNMVLAFTNLMLLAIVIVVLVIIGLVILLIWWISKLINKNKEANKESKKGVDGINTQTNKAKSDDATASTGGASGREDSSQVKGRTRRFAKGGIVNRPTMGLIGEAGPEAVIPLNKSMFGAQEQTVNIYLDGKQIARNTGKHLVKELNINAGLTNR